MSVISPIPNLAVGAAVLGRVSSAELAKGESVNRQIAFSRNFCFETLGMKESDPIFPIPEEGVSGKTFNRKGINKILSLASEGKLRYVVVFDVSRYGRNAKEGLQNLDQLLALGVDVKVATMPWLDLRTNHGRQQWTHLLSEAECYRGVHRDKAIMGMTGRAQLGHWKGGHPP